MEGYTRQFFVRDFWFADSLSTIHRADFFLTIFAAIPLENKHITKVFAKAGLDNVTSTMFMHQQWFRQTSFNLAFCCYLHHQFFNKQQFRAEGNSIFPPSPSPNVGHKP